MDARIVKKVRSELKEKLSLDDIEYILEEKFPDDVEELESLLESEGDAALEEYDYIEEIVEQINSWTYFDNFKDFVEELYGYEAIKLFLSLNDDEVWDKLFEYTMTTENDGDLIVLDEYFVIM